MERLAISDKATIVIERQTDGKMRVTSGSWDEEKVILRDQVLEVRNVDDRLHIARKPREHDEWDPFIPPYDPMAPAVMNSPMTEAETRHAESSERFGHYRSASRQEASAERRPHVTEPLRRHCGAATRYAFAFGKCVTRHGADVVTVTRHLCQAGFHEYGNSFARPTSENSKK